MDDQFVAALTIARFLGLSPRTIVKMAREGRIPAHAVSGARRRTWRFDLAEVKNFVMLSGRPGASAESE
jgi:excisionase family DNA binding protein